MGKIKLNNRKNEMTRRGFLTAGTVADMTMPLRTLNESKAASTGTGLNLLHSLSVELSSALTAGTVACTIKRNGSAVGGTTVTVVSGQAFATSTFEVFQFSGSTWTVEVNMSAGALPSPVDVKAELRMTKPYSANSSVTYTPPTGNDPHS